MKKLYTVIFLVLSFLACEKQEKRVCEDFICDNKKRFSMFFKTELYVDEFIDFESLDYRIYREKYEKYKSENKIWFSWAMISNAKIIIDGKNFNMFFIGEYGKYMLFFTEKEAEELIYSGARKEIIIKGANGEHTLVVNLSREPDYKKGCMCGYKTHLNERFILDGKEIENNLNDDFNIDY